LGQLCPNVDQGVRDVVLVGIDVRPILVPDVFRAGEDELVQGPPEPRGAKQGPQNVVPESIRQVFRTGSTRVGVISAQVIGCVVNVERSVKWRSVGSLEVLAGDKAPHNEKMQGASDIECPETRAPQ
jgi:hypothetical protein